MGLDFYVILVVIGLVIIAWALYDGMRKMRASKREDASDSHHDYDIVNSELPSGSVRVVKLNRDDNAAFDDAVLNTPMSDGDDAPRGRRAEPRDETRSVRQPGEQTGLFDDPSPRDRSVRRTSRHAEPAADSAIKAPVEEVIVINIMARKGERFHGYDLSQALMGCGMRHGEMKIFHRYDQQSLGKPQPLFSVANVVEPGFFNLDLIDEFETPGVVMFMQLPGPRRSLNTFSLMVDTAKRLASMLNAELRDENHSVLTMQTIEHYRQRVQDFERRQLARQSQPVK
ncbi:MAG TPA: cell division protein ZipA [Pseudomonadales bacterium]|nr:cell division protein ZipA [Pseudomonadales bacterium]